LHPKSPSSHVGSHDHGVFGVMGQEQFEKGNVNVVVVLVMLVSVELVDVKVDMLVVRAVETLPSAPAVTCMAKQQPTPSSSRAIVN
jgi:methenyltetrahydromethanopterin cyclohydrolase